MKSPFNYVGNKYNYMNIINQLVKNKKYENIYDLFMGTGNILLNIDVNYTKKIGVDILPLLPKIYNFIIINKIDISINDFKNIIKYNNYFSDKMDYYNFRDNWNKKYFNNEIDKFFIIETILLFKMCSNSMVRFNNKGEFNQGFRGIAKNKSQFFEENTIENIYNKTNDFINSLYNKNYIFKNDDFKNIEIKENSLLILDPPYKLMNAVYGINFTKEDDNYLLNLISNTKNDFIYFNYLNKGNNTFEELNDVIKKNNFNIITINNKAINGQGRNNTANDINEILVTNIK